METLERVELDESVLDHEPECECYRDGVKCGARAAYTSSCRHCRGQLGLMCKPHGDDLVRCFWLVYGCSMCGVRGFFSEVAQVVPL